MRLKEKLELANQIRRAAEKLLSNIQHDEDNRAIGEIIRINVRLAEMLAILEGQPTP